MNEEKINQILKNQMRIIDFIIQQNRFTKGDLTDCFFETDKLLNPTKQPSIAERTHNAFKENQKIYCHKEIKVRDDDNWLCGHEGHQCKDCKRKQLEKFALSKTDAEVKG